MELLREARAAASLLDAPPSAARQAASGAGGAEESCRNGSQGREDEEALDETPRVARSSLTFKDNVFLIGGATHVPLGCVLVSSSFTRRGGSLKVFGQYIK